MLTDQPRYRPVSPSPTNPPNFQPAVVTPHDARQLLDFIILAIEADRADYLSDFRFELQAEKPTLWLLPAQNDKIIAETVKG